MGTGVVCIADKHTQHAQVEDRGPVSRDDVALVAPPISSTDALLRSAPERVSTVGVSSGLQNWRLGLRGTAETDTVLPSVADVGPRETALDGLPSERETLIERTPEVSLGGGLVEIAAALGLLPERRKPRRGRGTPPRLRVEKSEDAQQTIDPNAVEPPSLQVALKNSDWFAVLGDPVAMPTRWRASKSVDRPHGPPPSFGDVQVHTGAEVAPLTCSTAGISVAASHRPQPALTDPTLRPSPQFGVESHPLIAAVEPRPSIPHDEPRQRSSESLEGCSSERDRQQSSEPKSRHASVVLKPDSAQHVVARRSVHSQAESHGSETDGSETDGSETDGSESDGSETEGSETDVSNSQNSDELARATTSTRPASLSPTQDALREEPRRASHQTGSRGPDKRGATLTALVGSTQDPPPQEHSAEHLRIPVDANSPIVQRTKPQVNHEVVTSSVAASVGARRQTASPSQGDTPLPSVKTLRTHRTAEVPAQSGRDSTHRSVTPHTLRVQRAAEVAGQPGRASTHRSVTPPTLRVHRAAEVVAHPGLGLARRSVTPPTLHVHRAAEIAAQPRRVSTHRSVTPPSRRAHKQSSVAGQPGRESPRRCVTPPHKKRDKTRQGTASSAGREEPEVDMMADIASSVWDFMGFGAQEPSREKASSRSASRHKHRDKKAHRSRTPTDR